MSNKLTKKQHSQLLEKKEVELESIPKEKVAIINAFFSDSASIITSDNRQLVCKIRKNIPPIVVGDKVVWENDNYSNIIIARIKRKNALQIKHKRLTHGVTKHRIIYTKSKKQIIEDNFENKNLTKSIAANIDQMLIVFASTPRLQIELLDMFLVNALQNDIKPIIIANKRDLDNKDRQEETLKIFRIYNKYFPCYYISSKENTEYFSHSLSLINILKGKTSILVGQSGVGKSSLINTLIPNINIKVGELSTKGIGQHTTSVSRCFLINSFDRDMSNQNTFIIDCPGIRKLSILPMNPLDLQKKTFLDIYELSKKCLFDSCLHENETGCYVKEAIDNKILPYSRLKSFTTIINEMKLIK